MRQREKRGLLIDTFVGNPQMRRGLSAIPIQSSSGDLENTRQFILQSVACSDRNNSAFDWLAAETP